MPFVGSDPDKRAYAHYRWAKRYAAESDERSSLAHLRRAIHYTARQRFGGAEIWVDPNLETWDTMVSKYASFSVHASEEVDGKPTVWRFPRNDKDKGKGEYESIIGGGYRWNTVTLEDERLIAEEWPMLTLVKEHIRYHKVLDDVSLEKNEGRSVTLTLRTGGGSEKQRLRWQDHDPLAIFEDLFYLVPKYAAKLKVDQKKIEEMSTALEKAELSTWRTLNDTGVSVKRAKREGVSSERE